MAVWGVLGRVLAVGSRLGTYMYCGGGVMCVGGEGEGVSVL